MAKKKAKQPTYEGIPHYASVPSNFSPGSTNHKHPIFCFKHLCKHEYGLRECNDQFKGEVLRLIHELSQLTWQQIQNDKRQGFGHEKIPVRQIKASIPRELTEDCEEVCVFRISSKARLAGHRKDQVFQVLWLDPHHKLYKG